MKSLFIAFFVVLFISCSADDVPTQVDYSAQNEQEIVDYIAAKGLDATRTDSGLYYIINEQGAGKEITVTSEVSIRFKGYYTDDTILDENYDNGIALNLQQTIAGLREGLTFFNEGGSGTLFIPAHLAYGSEGYGNIPGGAVLIFDIEVMDVDEENKEEIVKYIEENNLDAIESESGLFYVIEEPGTGSLPTENSYVTVVYKGYFTDGEVFDQSNSEGASFLLNQVIPGWQEGIPYFKEGGSGKLLIPSSLAYGRFGNQVIPGGAVIIFDVNLISVN